MTKIHFDDSDDLIDICRDNAFKAVFTKNIPESQGALSDLVSAIIGRPLSVITIIANEPPIDNLRDRQIRFDIKCKAKDGELVDVEMSLNPDAAGTKFPMSRFGWSSMPAGCLPVRIFVVVKKSMMT
ncbi:hypothetical protein AGMMS50267_18510 [Spirochaetia bacterium]|nr:hypothetical protein AGMMS50267_18510 [Spirochaetia bacterium]